MKFSLFLLAAGLCSFSAASAQTTPQNSPGTATPSTVPSGTAPVASDPNGTVTPGQVFTKGAPNSNTSNKRMMKRKNNKMSSEDKTKMKSTM